MPIFDDSIPALLNTEQVAALLGIKPHTLAVARCDDGDGFKIPYFKIGRSVRYRKTEVEAYLLERQRGESRC